MKYLDGKSIRVGDVVWYCYKTVICRVVQVIENEDELIGWGLEPGNYGIFLSSNPLSTVFDCDVYVSEKNFMYDNIEIVSDDEWYNFIKQCIIK